MALIHRPKYLPKIFCSCSPHIVPNVSKSVDIAQEDLKTIQTPSLISVSILQTCRYWFFLFCLTNASTHPNTSQGWYLIRQEVYHVKHANLITLECAIFSVYVYLLMKWSTQIPTGYWNQKPLLFLTWTTCDSILFYKVLLFAFSRWLSSIFLGAASGNSFTMKKITIYFTWFFFFVKLLSISSRY